MHKKETKIREETLLPASQWEVPTSDEVREMVRQTGLKAEDIIKLLGLTPHGAKSGRGSRTVRRWTSGESRIPYPAWCLLAYEAGFGIIWE